MFYYCPHNNKRAFPSCLSGQSKAYQLGGICHLKIGNITKQLGYKTDSSLLVAHGQSRA